MMLKSALRRFQTEEDGAAMTIEAILWFPLFIFLLIAVCDLSIIFMNKARMDRIVLDTQRSYAVGFLADCDAVEDQIERRARIIAPSAVATCTPDASLTTATVQFPANEIALTGTAGLLGNLMMNVRQVHTKERT